MILKRELVDKIKRDIQKSRITIILGARQVGKTCLMKFFMEELNKKREKTLFLDMEDIELRETAQNVSSFIEFIHLRSQIKRGEKLFLFLDEIQYLENVSSLLKLIADHHKNIIIIASGSSSLELRKKIEDSLAGRKRVNILYPLSFKEFLYFKGEHELMEFLENLNIENVSSLPTVYAVKLKKLFEEMCIYGAYPRIVLENEREERLSEIKEIYESYIEKDIRHFIKIENVLKFNKLIRFLSVQTGGMFSINDVCREIGIARETAEKYLFLMEKTFVINVVRPFYTNKQKELTKSPKIYFNDPGMRNFAIKDFRDLDIRPDKGELVENLVLCELLKNAGILDEILYWRTQSKNEVDFVIKRENAIIPIEVKYRSFQNSSLPKGLKSFIKQYSPPLAYVITENFISRMVYEKTEVRFIPAYMVSKIL